MRRPFQRLTHNMIALLLIASSPFFLTTNVLGAEAKTEIRQSDEILNDTHGLDLLEPDLLEPDSLNFHTSDRTAPLDTLHPDATPQSQPIQQGGEPVVEEATNASDAAVNSPGITSKPEDDANKISISRPDDHVETDTRSPSNGLFQASFSPFASEQSTVAFNIATDVLAFAQNPVSTIHISEPASDQYAQKSQAASPDINALLEEGNRQLDDKKYREAGASFDQALQLAGSTRDPIGNAQALSGKTAVALGLGQYAEAQNTATQALAILRKASQKYPEIEMDILLRQGYAYLGLEQLSDLESLLQQVTPLVTKLKPSEAAAGLLVSLADLQYAIGNKAAGNQAAQKAVTFLQKNPDPSGAIAILSRLAISQYASEKPDETVQSLDRLTALVDQLKEQPRKISLLQTIGGLYLKLGEAEDLKSSESERARQLFEKARQSFEKANWLFNAQDNKTEENAKILLGLGRAYLSLHRNEEAIEQAQQAIAIINELEQWSVLVNSAVWTS